jgi:hypothetical protein
MPIAGAFSIRRLGRSRAVLYGVEWFSCRTDGVLNRRWRLGEPRRSYRGVDRGGCTRIIGWFCWRKARVKRGLFETLNIRPSTFGGITMCPSSHLCMCCKWRALALPFQDASRLHWQEQAAERKVLTPVAIDPPPEILTGTQRDAIQRKCLMARQARHASWIGSPPRIAAPSHAAFGHLGESVEPFSIFWRLSYGNTRAVRPSVSCARQDVEEMVEIGPQLGLELKLRHQPCRG